MRKVTRIVVTAVAVIALLCVANTAQAGEPLHPFYQPVADFFQPVVDFFRSFGF